MQTYWNCQNTDTHIFLFTNTGQRVVIRKDTKEWEGNDTNIPQDKQADLNFGYACSWVLLQRVCRKHFGIVGITVI